MAAFSPYQQPLFLSDTAFLPTEFVPNYHQIYASSYGNSDNNIQGCSFDASTQSSCIVEQQIIHNNTCLTEKHSSFSSSMADKSENGDQNNVHTDKKRKSQHRTPSNSANSKGAKQVKTKKQKGEEETTKNEEKKGESKGGEEAPKGYIHVRARRGQATDSHSLAERVRREKISKKMGTLQALVPGCDKVTGKALMLDEIINYVQSLQNQVEFLSMKLASVDPMVYTFGLMDHDSTVFETSLQGMNNNMALPNPLIESTGANTSGSTSPTQALGTANSSLGASPATSSTLSATFPNTHVENSTNLVQFEHKPIFFPFQDVGSSYWGINEQERQSIINHFGLCDHDNNNLYSLH
ncbi:hypothetical protein RND81_10G202900 [Saponaria officinalis]|uniref:BHLH domain-containing protein n=1 Tax=Saponaria officinalis TaxID=3572 RepID=A0AAW1I6U7_SAPOF